MLKRKRHLKKIRGKEQRLRNECDHIVSKQIVQDIKPNITIALEKLTHIRKRATKRYQKQHNYNLNTWSFKRLQNYITYKAVEKGCTVVEVKASHTSQTCSHCGYRDATNRLSRSEFKCISCGFTLHADLNAARNIAVLGISQCSGLPVNQAIVRVPTCATYKLPALAGSN